MVEPDGPHSLKDLGDRLKGARQVQKAGQRPTREERDAAGAAHGWAWRVAIEMVVAVAFGGYLGWLLDNWLGTLPLFLVVFFLLGAGAGIVNVIRAAQAMNAPQDGAKDGNKNGNSGAGTTARKQTDGNGGGTT